VVLWQISGSFSEGHLDKEDPFHKHEHPTSPSSLQDYQPISNPKGDVIVVQPKADIWRPGTNASPVDPTTRSGLWPIHEFEWLGGREFDKSKENGEFLVSGDRFGGFAEGEIDRLEREALDKVSKSVEKEGGETVEEFKARMKAQQEIIEKFASLKQEVERFFNELKNEPITSETLDKIYAKFPEWGFKESPYWMKHSLFPEKP
jgi:hypothetical protein